MNGTFWVVLGAVWNEVRLAARAKTIAYWTALYGTYVNCLVTVLEPVRFLRLQRLVELRHRGRRGWLRPDSSLWACASLLRRCWHCGACA